ncbi:MAG: hypothetical protein A3F54_05325 [Candidatus Kerfeldbacteria bacterium RIFCSPHIGHO2_12_FULL_48_17]|uniref:DUF1648 domain-containing protein n=1 Tax=Candidatus Kerfeldbacteria bacterium RIFCSPHIGHO2_12_FULL_48_17 TaxID=1798542 RepID=A0A1G2B3J4_9BACT|nr:MAG: hypothetical protein A3F54_05325 [Candidatus Kerfeldbacteria bacterium RIFCSPHIGHO2_12_FULL_48_17]
MKFPLIFKKVSFFLPVFFALVLNLLLWAFFVYKFPPQEEPLVLHYNIYFGIDLIGPWWQIFFLPATGAVIWLVNILLAAFFYSRDRFLAAILVSTSLLIQIILTVSAVFITLIN